MNLDSLDKDLDQAPNPLPRANIFSKAFYCWVWPLLLRGRKKELEQEDLMRVLNDDESHKLGDKLEAEWSKEVEKSLASRAASAVDDVEEVKAFTEAAQDEKKEKTGGPKEKNGKKDDDKGDDDVYKPSLGRAAVRAFWPELTWSLAYLLFFREFFRVTLPICLGYYMEYFKDKEGSNTSELQAWLAASGIVMSSFLSVMASHLYYLRATRLGMRFRVAFSSLIYRKAIRLNQSAFETSTTGQMVNLLSNDVGRFDLAFIFLHYLWIAPLQLIVVLALSYAIVGWPIFVGCSILISMIPFQIWMARKFSEFRLATAKKTDVRIRLMNEIVAGIRVVKMYAWENSFAKLVNKARREETNVTFKSSMFRALNLVIYFTTSDTVLVIMLLPIVLMGKTVTPEMVFLPLGWINILKLSLAMFLPNGVAFLSEARISTKRIQDFMLLNELGKNKESAPLAVGAVASDPGSKTGEGLTPKLEFDHAVCHWSDSAMEDTLFDINFKIDSPQVVAVVGRVGSGKSSLIQSVLGEIEKTSGKILVEGKVSFTAQNPFVFSGTVRENVLFGEEMDRERYERTLEVTCLQPDIQSFENGDMTIIGDRGVSLSGGQKARISLARAVYRIDSDIFLLDDPLSAVDVHVGKQIFDKCVLEHLKGKIVVLATHQLHFLKNGISQILVMERGTLRERGTYAELTADPDSVFNSLLQQQQTPDDDEFSIARRQSESETPSPIKDVVPKARLATPEKVLEEDIDDPSAPLAQTNGTLLNGHTVKVKIVNGTGGEDGRKDPNFQRKEIGQKGVVKWSTYSQYFLSGANVWLILLFIILTLCMHGCEVFVQIWLSIWTGKAEDYQQTTDDVTNGTSYSNSSSTANDDRDMSSSHFYFGIFAGVVGAIVLLTSANAVAYFTISIRAARRLHNNMFSCVLKSPVRFFDLTPNGRILNRFSKDVGNMDELLPACLIDVLWIICSVISSIVIVASGVPYMLIPAFLLGVVFFLMRSFYMKSSRAVKRSEGIARSPIFSLVGTSLEGLSTLRAFKMELKLTRLFDRQQDVHSSAWFSFLSLGRWLGMSSDLLVIAFLAVAVTLPLIYGDFSDAQVAMVVTAASMLTGGLQYCLRQTAEAESLFTSVERILEYGTLPSEYKNSTNQREKPPSEWTIREGKIEFKGVCMRYGDEDPNVLDTVSFTVEAGQKVGIVGRTGAGKSSLIAALFRLTEIHEGEILIDGVDLKSRDLDEVRRNIAIIPQDPLLFAGTMRSNLDPFEEYPDTDLWRALDQAHLSDALSLSKNGLDTEVLESGSNFSVGEKQLICLARAILRNNKVLVLDEATANVDPKTDSLIQATIRQQFSACSVCTIAHRLNTIMDSDKILVMGKGQVLEFDPPHQLLQTEGALVEMINHTAPETQRKLRKMAKEAYHSKSDEENALSGARGS